MNLINRLKSLSLRDVIGIILWTVTFIFLMVVIIVASCKNNFDANFYANTIAAMVFVFSIFLIASLLYIVISKFIDKKKGENR